jgi:hypothetical protein
MSNFINNNIELLHKKNKETLLNPLVDIYRGKCYTGILKSFIYFSIKTFGTEIFSIKKSYPRTLTNILSSWLFSLYSDYDYKDDPFLPSNYNNMKILHIIFSDFVKHDTKIENINEKINIVLNELKKSYKYNLDLLNGYKIGDYFLKNKNKYNITKLIPDDKNFYKFNIKLSFYIKDNRLNNILNNILIPIKVYDRMKNKYTGPINKLDEYIWIILFRYQLLGSNNNQLGVLPKILNKMTEDLDLDFECFASAINSTSPYYCSIYYDVEKFFGSKGSFFNMIPLKGTYSFNPPYQTDVITNGINKLLKHLEFAENRNYILNFIITIPIWDIEGKCTMSELSEEEESSIKDNNIDYGEFEIMNIIKKNKYFKGYRMIRKEDFTYLDHNFNIYKDVTIQNTYIMILSSDKNNIFMDKINKYTFKNK